MNGVEKMHVLKNAGFDDAELGAWARDTSILLSNAGMSQGEIDTYFGHPPFDPKPLVDHFNTSLEQARASSTADAQKPVKNFAEAMAAAFGEGWDGGTIGLLINKPTRTPRQDISIPEEVARTVGMIFSDSPALAAGYVLGGANPVTGTAGAVGLSEGFKRILIDKYNKGEVTGFRDFWDRSANATIATLKGWVTGAVAGKVGQMVEALPFGPPVGKEVAARAAELAAFIGVGRGLEGEIPEPRDFLVGAATLGFVKGTHKAATKLQEIWIQRGVTPAEVMRDVEKDPTIAQDLASEDVVIPRAYQAAEKPAEAPIPTPPVPRSDRFVLALQGKLEIPPPKTPAALPAPEPQRALPPPSAIEKPGQQEIPVPPPTIGQRPIIGREPAPGEAPLFEKGHLAPEQEQTGLFEQAAPRVTGFTTAKGSTYTITEGGQTVRNKAARPEHPGDSGVKPPSDTTFYVDSDGLNALSEITAKGVGPKRIIAQLEDGRIGVKYLDGKDAGKFEKRTVVTPQKEPAVGLYPIELWRGGEEYHFGNKITGLTHAELSRQELATTPRHLAPIDQNAELLARAEKALADVEMAGQERGGRYYQETQGQGGDMEVTGLKSATADWYKEATTGERKLSRKRVEVALQKIIEGKGKDVGSDVQRIKELLLGDREFESSPYAPRNEEEWARARQYAMAEWEPDIAMGGGAPGKPPKPAGPPPEPERPPSDAEAAILAKIVREDQKPPSMGWREFYTNFVENLHPIWGDLKDIGKEKLPTAENPFELMRLTRGTMGKGTQFFKRGAFKFDTYETVTRGYEEIIQPVKKDLARLSAYMVSKRVIEKEAQGIPTGFDLAQATEVVKKGAARFQAIHEELLTYRDAYLQYLVDAGLVPKDSLPAMREANKDYVPFDRLWTEQPGGKPGSSHTVKNPLKRMTGSERAIHDPILTDIKNTYLFIGMAERNAARLKYVAHPELATKKPTPVKPITLTDKEIRSIFEKFLTVREEVQRSRTETTTAADVTAAKPLSKQAEMVVDRVKEALISRGYHPEEADQYINRVVVAKSGKVASETVIREVESRTYVPELDTRVPTEAATIFRGFTEPVGKDEMVVFRDGKREIYKVNPATAEAFQDLDRVSTNFVTDMILHTPANLLRAGVIVTPEYISRNIINDALAAFIYTGTHPIKTIKGGVSILKKDDAYQKWMKGGGGNATMVALDRDYIQSHIMDLNLETGVFQRAWNVARTPLDVLRVVSEFVENSTRLGAVRSELQQAKDKATIQALSMIAREATVDFARHGKAMQEFAKSTAFFNPHVQGVDRLMRALKENPQATLAKGFGSIFLPAFYLWWANKDDKEIQNLPDWQKKTMLIARIPLAEPLRGLNAGKDSFLLRIPIAHELGILFGTLPVALIDKFVTDNPDALRNMDKILFEAFAPGIIPTMPGAIVQQFANTNTLSGGPLVPAHAEKLLPEYQYTPYTTELTKAIGGLIGAFPGMEESALRKDWPLSGGIARALTSPILIEHYIRQWTGGTGMYIVQLVDKAMREAGVLPDPVKPASTLADLPFFRAFIARYPSTSAQPIQTFFEDAGVVKTKLETFMMLAKSGDPRAKSFGERHRADLQELDGFTTTLGQMTKMIRDLHKLPSHTPDGRPLYTPEEKRQLIDTLIYRTIEIAEAGNTFLRQAKAAVKTMEDARTLSFRAEPNAPAPAPSLSAPMRQAPAPNRAAPPSIGP